MFFFDRDLSLEEFRRRLGGRIAQAVDKAETKSQAADAAGVSVEQLNKWMKGTVKVPVDALRALSAYANVDFSWLITGEGEPSPVQGSGPEVQTMGSLTDLDQPGMVSIPRYDEVRPSAGPGSVATSETPTTRVAFERHWLTEIGVQTASAVILPAQGDSMEPTIMNGSPMLVDTSKTEVRSGFIYVFNIDGDLVVKRIERRPDASYDLISDNRRYPSWNLTREKVSHMTVVGRVYASVSKF